MSGLWTSEHSDKVNLSQLSREMSATLAHRGPDDFGEWTDCSAGIALAFRRLAILDLSPLGHQPMISPTGRYVVAFNGEVYNFAALRAELEGLGRRFRGQSDTEVMLAAIEEWGVEAAVTHFVGMFAIALWDASCRRLILIRDRLGKKPLYFTWQNGSFIFGSELKALRAAGVAPRVNRRALALFLRHGYVPAPLTIYEGVAKLPPGTMLTVTGPTDHADPRPYWRLLDVVQSGVRQPFQGSDGDAIDHLDSLLKEAVKIRMVADVPVGAFLSGGIDSSTIVALMQSETSVPVKTFTIGFMEDEYDEAGHARQVAAHLGTEHTELYVTPTEAMGVVPSIAEMFDEPFGDQSQIPTFLVSKLARSEVTVALSGDGGDEVFAGYDRYLFANSVARKVSLLPFPVRRLLSALLNGLPEWSRRAAPHLAAPLGHRLAVLSPQRLQKLSQVLPAHSGVEIYRILASHWSDPCSVVQGLDGCRIDELEPLEWEHHGTLLESMAYMDTLTYLPDDILTKVDRASMAVSLEARNPLLDHRVVEFAWRLPISLKIRRGGTKWILRQVLDRYVPARLVDRPKMGFGVPVGEWLRGPLRQWASDLLSSDRLAREGYFRPKQVELKWREHLDGRAEWQYLLWDVLMFECWLDRWAS